jgi:hypothetical protein
MLMPKDEKCSMFGCEKPINPDEEYLVVTHVKGDRLEQSNICSACMGGAKMVRLVLTRTGEMLKVEERICL